MKKVLSVFMMSFLIIMSGMPVFADMGAPSEPEFTIVLSIEGVPFYGTYEDFDAGSPDGTLTGGQTFYVWGQFDNGSLWGTTDANKGSSQIDSFVYISDSEGMPAAEMVSPDLGIETEGTVTAATTDVLNLRYGPGTGFKVIKTLNKDTEVTYNFTYTTDTTWMYVNAAGTEGWVSGDYLKQKSVADKSADTAAEEESSSTLTPVQGQESTGSLQKTEETAGKDKKRFVAGIICICAGIAVLLSVIAVYILNNRRTA